MKLTVLASGSKGNCAVISAGRTHVLVDAGLSCREIFKRMREAGEDPDQLDAIVITHEHVDHVNGLGVTARKLGIPVYITQQTHSAWVRMMTPRTTMTYTQWIEMRRKEAVAEPVHPDMVADLSEGLQDVDADELVEIETAACDEASAQNAKSPQNAQNDTKSASNTSKSAKSSVTRNLAELPAIEYFTSGRDFCIGDINITPFTIPHDAADPVGFVFEAAGIRFGHATDLGYVPPNVKLALRRCQLLVLESNHDLEMLRDGPYPWQVKQRVLSRVGHLSNDAAAEFLLNEYDGGAEYIVLAHLSESNNLPELARIAAEKALNERGRLLGNRLLLAEQARPLESICL